MTPYAVLAAKPTDSDEVIRKTYHALVRYCHPDAVRGLPQESKDKLTARWHEYTAAYTAIKTIDSRKAWQRQQDMRSGECSDCGGCGVRGTRMFKGHIRTCDTCKGEGRV